MSRRLLATLGLSLCLLAPSGAQPAEDPNIAFGRLADRFLNSYLELNPEIATTLGEHRYDGRWTDYSATGERRYLETQNSLLKELEGLPSAGLGWENRVDYDILSHHLQGQLWSWGELREQHWNPLLYNPGPALFALVARDYAPPEERLENLAQRLERIPELLAQARSQLHNPPELHCRVAIEQNAGTIAFLENDLEPFFSQVPGLRSRLHKARDVARAALQDYGRWLESDLLPRSRGDFRLGPERYRRKLFFTLESELSAEQVAQRAQADLLKTQKTMAQVARQLYPGLIGKPAEGLEDREVCRQVLSRLADEHPTSADILEKARLSLDKATRFVQEREIVSLPAERCAVIEMPEFARGVAVAYCDSPGPLEKAGETFYAIAPTPKDWSEQRSLSFYREYNLAMLDDLTVHEAMPGHFLQLMHANRFQAPTRIRAVLQSGTFVEGWATYAEEVMAEAGYGGPEVRMQQLKMRLRLILNALLDQKVHVGGVGEKEAIAWLQREGYQEEGEATGKWKRACLTSAQLSTYYVGNCEVGDLAAELGRRRPQLSLKERHDRLLAFGSPAPRYIRRLLFGSSLNP